MCSLKFWGGGGSHKCNPASEMSVKVAEISCLSFSSDQIKAVTDIAQLPGLSFKYDELNLNLQLCCLNFPSN